MPNRCGRCGGELGTADTEGVCPSSVEPASPPLLALMVALSEYVEVVDQCFMQTEIGRNCFPCYAEALRKAGRALKDACAKALLVVLILLASGCASTSVRAVREQGGQPTCWERVQLNACDGVSWLNGAIPFGGGQD